MFWWYRFILLLVAAYVFKNHLHAVSAIANKAKTVNNILYDEESTNLAKKYSPLPLQNSFSMERKRPKRETLNHTMSEVSELTTLPPLDYLEQLTKMIFLSFRGIITDLRELIKANKDEVMVSINQLKREIVIENKVRDGYANEQRHLLNESINEVREIIDAHSKTHHTPETVAPLKFQSTKSILLNYFRQISNSKTISGIYVDVVGKSSNEGVQTIEKIASVSPGIITTQMPRYLSSETQWTSFIEQVIFNWSNRLLIRIQWWNGNPLANLRIFTDTSNKGNIAIKWAYLTQDGSEVNKVWKEELDKVAPYLHKLQSAGVVPIFDILPLMNSKEYIWRGRPGVDGTAKLFKITRDYLTKQHNLTSLIWSWSLDSEYMTEFEEFWPGSEYVDVISVHIGTTKELPINEYEKLINLVGDKPLSMEAMYTVPSLDLLTAQPRWTWFTASDSLLEDTDYNIASDIKATLSSPSVINKGNIDFFNDNN